VRLLRRGEIETLERQVRKQKTLFKKAQLQL
jgi:hypothetical protein